MDTTSISNIDECPDVALLHGHPVAEALDNFSFGAFTHLVIRGYLPSLDQTRAQQRAEVKGISLGEDLERLLLHLANKTPVEKLLIAVAALSVDVTEEDWDFVLLGALYGAVGCLLGSARTNEIDHLSRENWSLPRYLLRGAFGPIHNDLEQRGFERALAILAEHGANNSTFTARVVASTKTSPTLSVLAAMASFAGPLHGKAVELAFSDVKNMTDAPDGKLALDQYVNDVRTGRIRPMGFGHALYAQPDPRAAELERVAASLVKDRALEPLLVFATSMIDALSFLQSRGLYPNCDLFAGIVYKALGFQPPAFTVVHALGRAPGWIAHIKEQHRRATLIRPLFRYVPDVGSRE